jgi:hypothetical protein
MGLASWILSVSGGEGFSIDVPHNPTILHEPHKRPTLVSHLTLTGEQAEELMCVLHCVSANALLRRVDEASPEQEEEQKKLLGLLGQEDRVWPSSRCPSCFWFDPLLAGMPCGETGWPLAMAKEAYQNLPKAKEDLDSCPVRSPRHPE